MPNPRKPRTFIPSKYTRYTVFQSWMSSMGVVTDTFSLLDLLLPLDVPAFYAFQYLNVYNTQLKRVYTIVLKKDREV